MTFVQGQSIKKHIWDLLVLHVLYILLVNLINSIYIRETKVSLMLKLGLWAEYYLVPGTGSLAKSLMLHLLL